MKPIVRILPCAQSVATPDAKDKGWRLKLTLDPGENLELVEEQVLPERVMRPDANRILASLGKLVLTTAEARWLLEQLAELVPMMEKQLADDQAEVCKRHGAEHPCGACVSETTEWAGGRRSNVSDYRKPNR